MNNSQIVIVTGTVRETGGKNHWNPDFPRIIGANLIHYGSCRCSLILDLLRSLQMKSKVAGLHLSERIAIEFQCESFASLNVTWSVSVH